MRGYRGRMLPGFGEVPASEREAADHFFVDLLGHRLQAPRRRGIRRRPVRGEQVPEEGLPYALESSEYAVASETWGKEPDSYESEELWAGEDQPYTPHNRDALVIRGRRAADGRALGEFTHPRVRIRNWAYAEVNQFPSPGAPRDGDPIWRAPGDIHAVVLHETAGNEPWSNNIVRNMQTRGASVQAFVDTDGTVIQTNDLVQRMAHGSAANRTSIGFEIVNRVLVPRDRTGENNRTLIRNTKLYPRRTRFRDGGPVVDVSYKPPTLDQLKAVYEVVGLLTELTGTIGHGLGITRDFPDFADGTFTANRALQPHGQGAVPRATERSMRPRFATRRGIFSHSSFQSNKFDGMFAVLFCWLRFIAREGGRRITDDQRAREICYDLLGDPAKVIVQRRRFNAHALLVEKTLDVSAYWAQ